jgi:hypothetical protein
MQSQDPATMMQAGGEQQSGDEAENESGSTVIEITIAADGSITVEQETGGQESAEESGGGEESGAAPVKVKNIDQALEVVRQMYESSQKTPEESTKSAVADQAAGYNQA